MQEFKIDELKPHPRNEEFFDDITGKKWDEFLASIKKEGVIEPLIVTQDKVIVSGHQRLKACKELGIETVMCEVKVFNDDDDVLLALLESNERQRGNIGGSMQKILRRGKELERLYAGSKTKKEVANELGISANTYRVYELLHSVPELEEAIEKGMITQKAALAVIKHLSEEEQLKLLSKLDSAKKYTSTEAKKYIKEIETLKAMPPEVIEKVPDDYELNREDLIAANEEITSLMEENEDLKEKMEMAQDDRDFERRDKSKWVKKSRDLEKQIEAINSSKPEEQAKKDRINASIYFSGKVSRFIEDVGGYVWLSEEINELPNEERDGYIRSVQKIKNWADQLLYNIENKMKEVSK